MKDGCLFRKNCVSMNLINKSFHHLCILTYSKYSNMEIVHKIRNSLIVELDIFFFD